MLCRSNVEIHAATREPCQPLPHQHSGGSGCGKEGRFPFQRLNLCCPGIMVLIEADTTLSLQLLKKTWQKLGESSGAPVFLPPSPRSRGEVSFLPVGLPELAQWMVRQAAKLAEGSEQEEIRSPFSEGATVLVAQLCYETCYETATWDLLDLGSVHNFCTTSQANLATSFDLLIMGFSTYKMGRITSFFLPNFWSLLYNAKQSMDTVFMGIHSATATKFFIKIIITMII